MYKLGAVSETVFGAEIEATKFFRQRFSIGFTHLGEGQEILGSSQKAIQVCSPTHMD